MQRTLTGHKTGYQKCDIEGNMYCQKKNIYFNNLLKITIRISEKSKKITEKVQDEYIKKKLIELYQEEVFKLLFMLAISYVYIQLKDNPFENSIKHIADSTEKYMKKTIEVAKKELAKELTQ